MPQDQYQRTFPFSRVPIMHPALLYDDGEGTWKWKRTIFGAGPTYEYDPVAALVGLNGIQLQTGGTQPAANDLISIYRQIWLPAEEQVRLQVCFNLVAAAPEMELAILLHWFTSVNHYLGGLKFNSNAASVSYASSVAAGSISWTQIAGWLCQNSDDCWNRADMAINLRTLAYQRLNVNEHVMDGAALPFPSEASGLGKYLEVHFLLQTLAAAQATVYLDQVLVTPENP